VWKTDAPVAVPPSPKLHEIVGGPDQLSSAAAVNGSAPPALPPTGSVKAVKRGPVASNAAVWIPLSSRQAVSASPWPSAARSPRKDVPTGKPPRAGPPTSSTGSQAPPSRWVPVTTPARKPESHAATGTPPAVIAPYGCEFPRAVPAVSGAAHAVPAPARSAAAIAPPCFHSAS